MAHIYETYTLKNGTVLEVSYNETGGENPREWDNLGKLSLHHRRYDLANELGIDSDDYGSWDEHEKAICKKLGRDAVILPVSMYDHGSISIYVGSPSCRWDSGQLGFVAVSREDIRKEYGVKRVTKSVMEKAIKCLTSEVETYSSYVNGDVFDFRFFKDGEETDESFCGIIGYDGLKSELKSYGIE